MPGDRRAGGAGGSGLGTAPAFWSGGEGVSAGIVRASFNKWLSPRPKTGFDTKF